MKYLIMETLLTLIILICIQVVRHYSKKMTLFGCWVKALRSPLLVLLLYSWIYQSIHIIPWVQWAAHFVSPLYKISMSEAATLLSKDAKSFWVYLSLLFSSGYVALSFWLSMCVLKKLETDIAKKQGTLSVEFNSAIDSGLMFLRAAVYIYFVFLVMRLFKLNYLADSLFTTGAVGALAISFAARDSISNIFGGCMILLDRPFRIGDYISSPDRNIEGTVERIGWRVTLVRTPTKSIKYIPNTLFTTLTIENSTRRTHRLMRIVIGLRYDDLDKVKLICEDIQKLLDESDFIDDRMANYNTFNELADFSVNIVLNWYVKSMTLPDFFKAQEKVLFRVVEIVKARGADFPFPTTTLDTPEIVVKLQESLTKRAD